MSEKTWEIILYKLKHCLKINDDEYKILTDRWQCENEEQIRWKYAWREDGWINGAKTYKFYESIYKNSNCLRKLHGQTVHRDADMDFCERLLLRWEHIHDTKDKQAAEYFLKHFKKLPAELSLYIATFVYTTKKWKRRMLYLYV